MFLLFVLEFYMEINYPELEGRIIVLDSKKPFSKVLLLVLDRFCIESYPIN